MSARKYKNPISVSLPTFCHHLVFFLSPLKIHREQMFRAFKEVGQFIILCSHVIWVEDLAVAQHKATHYKGTNVCVRALRTLYVGATVPTRVRRMLHCLAY